MNSSEPANSCEISNRLTQWNQYLIWFTLIAYIFYCFFPYPGMMFDSIYSNAKPFSTEKNLSRIFKDIICLMMFLFIAIEIYLKKEIKKSALSALAICCTSVLIASTMTFVSTNFSSEIRVIYGIRSISYFCVPFLLGLSLKIIPLNVRTINKIVTASLIITFLHTILLHIGFATTPYFNYSGTFKRSIGVFGEPNLMAFLMSLSALFFLEMKKYIRFFLSLLLVLTCFSYTGLSPLIVYGFLKIRPNQRSKILILLVSFVSLTAMPRIISLYRGNDYSSTGKLVALKDTALAVLNGTPSQFIFGKGFSIVDGSGQFLNMIGLNPYYFSSESTYNAVIVQYGIITLLFGFIVICVALFRLRHIKNNLAVFSKLIILSVTISNFGLLYLSIFPVISIFGLSLGFAFNDNLIGKRVYLGK